MAVTLKKMTILISSNHHETGESIHVDLGVVDQRGRAVGYHLWSAEYDVTAEERMMQPCTTPHDPTKAGHYFVKYGHPTRDGNDFGGASIQVSGKSLEQVTRDFDAKLVKATKRTRARFTTKAGPVTATSTTVEMPACCSSTLCPVYDGCKWARQSAECVNRLASASKHDQQSVPKGTGTMVPVDTSKNLATKLSTPTKPLKAKPMSERALASVIMDYAISQEAPLKDLPWLGVAKPVILDAIGKIVHDLTKSHLSMVRNSSMVKHRRDKTMEEHADKSGGKYPLNLDKVPLCYACQGEEICTAVRGSRTCRSQLDLELVPKTPESCDVCWKRCCHFVRCSPECLKSLKVVDK